MIKKCFDCSLCEKRRHMVIGRGNIKSDIIIIGDAPSISDDLVGKPYTGLTGIVLDYLLNDVGIDGNKYYITNTVMCRPVDLKSYDYRSPHHTEILKCMKNVEKIIHIMKPKRAILLGDIAQKFYSNRFTDVLFLQHPSFLQRTGGPKSPYYPKNYMNLKIWFAKGK